MKAAQEQLREVRLVGIALPQKTINEDGRAMADIGGLWQRWGRERVAEAIPNRTGDEVYAVYDGYDGDHTRPYACFIGCEVSDFSNVPEGLSTRTIPAGVYTRVLAKGKLPDAIAGAWREIWASGIRRSYAVDFELYGDKSRDWNDGEVVIYLS